MRETFEKSKREYFVYPDIQKEEGEFDRVAEEFNIDTSVLMFQARNGGMVQCDEALLCQLENTDVRAVILGDWEAVEYNSNPNEEKNRDWESLKDKMEKGVPLDAPIIMQFGDRYHLVSGNTRLMVSRAMGIYPKVLMFEIYLHNDKEKSLS